MWKGLRSYYFLKTRAQREMYLTRALFGLEISAEVAVFHGTATLVDFRAGSMECDGKMGHTFPAYAPGWDKEVQSRCTALVQQVVAKAGLYNAVVGVQLFYDWRNPEAGCSLIELNPRPVDHYIGKNPFVNLYSLTRGYY